MSRRVLVNQLTSARVSFAGIGTRAVKMKLNRLAKSDAVAKSLRLALEIEDCSTLGKKYFGDWSNHYYSKKSQLIHELIELFKTEGWLYGKHKSENFYPKWIIYFELQPTGDQISFHYDLDYPDQVPHYPHEWDGKRNSTLIKLEAAIIAYLDSERNMFR